MDGVGLTGLDIAPRSTGWCSGTGEAMPACGAWAFPALGADVGALLDLFDRALAQHIEEHCPAALVFEAPILVFNDHRRGNDKLENVRRMYAMTGHVEFVCRRRGIECAEVDLRAMKRELTGTPKADKAMMCAVADRLGLALPTLQRAREDAADAFSAWLLLLRSRNRIWSERFDRALYGGRANALI